jgi:DNA polymerase I-like protein with 3'-5' exonuclease and polymerase domains
LGVSNPGSDKEVGAALTALGVRLPQTPTGRPSVAASALEALRGTPGNAGALVAAVLDYRHHETVVSTFLEPYRRLVEHGDGRARPTVYTLGTDTGRMSCVRPNLQQLPREGGVRACITADPGYTLISADFAGVELRVAAALSGDANLAAMIARGDDLHWMIAREVFGPEATKADRYVAKRVVFGRLYGGGATTLARQAGVSESIAQSAIDVLDSITPGLSAWSRTIRDAVKRGTPHFPTYSGRVIWLPAEYPHKGPNYAIQGSARELLVDALIRWDDTEWRGGVVLPVHDEIVAMVPEADAERATAALVACMASNLGGVEIKAEASKPSVSWQDSV